jgi:hypothetical protein
MCTISNLDLYLHPVVREKTYPTNMDILTSNLDLDGLFTYG